ncbi:rhamnan synthesis F family protein [Aeromonas caviae]|uniref:rhamnan synthesis F family protein n=1 Tax=Aeromonas caviae TaxID=648 RepID=UPI0029DCF7C4|nr:rhamnan synthesis F family protein [Aeromonas caviae]MDX7724979.1 rhamnan synthesis F family protein [Aeromonas caviae]MDX7751776.1 rhamnan synthesis F family protein [Aeromonas caviae]MDX7869345.1 rhamnan synthesis F family protein [Aeromonas caviae]
MKRIAFYLFYDKDGVVDEYVYFKLKELKKSVDEIFFVSNSKIKANERAKLEQIVDTVYCRDNIGFDVWGYKEAMEIYGPEKLELFDELILLNYTFFGPIFPFEEMFEWSQSQQVDFWGVSDHKEVIPNPFTGESILPRHIQSHFIAIRKNMFTSIEFKQYWKNMPMIYSYTDSIVNHESKFTQHFSDKGFGYDVYVNSEDYPSSYATFNDVCQTLENRSPILKRRPFFHDPLWIDRNAIDLRRALEIINEKSNYNVNLIYENLLRTTKPKDLATNIDLLKIFDKTKSVEINKPVRIAAVLHVYYADMIEEMMGYIENIPVSYDLFISTASEKSKKEIEFYLENNKNKANKIEVRVVEQNRGRDIGALLLTMKDVGLSDAYDYICRLHSKKSPQNDATQAEHFKHQMYDNLVPNENYVSKLINFLNDNPKVGFLAPSMVHIGYPTLGHSWFNNRELATIIAKKLDINVPFDDFSPFAAYGTMFWFRPKALKKLFSYNWKWNDFNSEPGHNDGSLAHVIERLFIYVAHSNGYLGYNIMSSDMAEKNYAKLEYKAQRVMSNLHNGLVQDQVHHLQHLRYMSNASAAAVNGSSIKASARALFLACARSILFRFPRIGRLLKRIYLKMKHRLGM